MSNRFPNGIGVKIDTMDGTLDLADVSWQVWNPAGELVSIGYAALSPREYFATAEEWLEDYAEWCEPPTTAAALIARGYTARPREHHASCDEYAKANAR